jgi:hypothetical protein
MKIMGTFPLSMDYEEAPNVIYAGLGISEGNLFLLDLLLFPLNPISPVLTQIL